MSTNTPTPRTDAAEQRDITGLGVVQVDFARQLERELQQATQELRDADRGADKRLKRMLEAEEKVRVQYEQLSTLRSDLARVTAERDEHKKSRDAAAWANQQLTHVLITAEAPEFSSAAHAQEWAVEVSQLRARAAELEQSLKNARSELETSVSGEMWRAGRRDYEWEKERAEQAEQRNAELETAMRKIAAMDEVTIEYNPDEVLRIATESATPAKQSPAIDAESLIAACIPGGSICDPQQVADAIREYLRPQEPCGGQCGDPECDLDTMGVTMRTPAPHADTVRGGNTHE